MVRLIVEWGGFCFLDKDKRGDFKVWSICRVSSPHPTQQIASKNVENVDRAGSMARKDIVLLDKKTVVEAPSSGQTRRGAFSWGDFEDDLREMRCATKRCLFGRPTVEFMNLQWHTVTIFPY